MNQNARRRRAGVMPTLEGAAARNTQLDQGMPSGPMRMSGAQRAVLAQNAVPVQQVREVNRYPNLITLSFTNLPQASQAVIPVPDGRRIFFSARNSSASAGILFIAFGTNADITNAQFELPAGGMMVLDAVVPQQEVYLGCSAAGVNVVLTFGDSAA